MQHVVALIALVALAACEGKNTSEPPPASPPGTPLAKSPAKSEQTPADKAKVPAAEAGKTPAKSEKRREAKKLSKEERARFRAHMRAGAKAQKAKQWPRAVAEYEAAVAIYPASARAYSELGWVAFKAKDYGKSTRANEQAVRLAKKPDLQAASLYNAGRAAEAKGQKDRAMALYTESLRLRPNKIVRKRLEAMGGEMPEPMKRNTFTSTKNMCGYFHRGEGLRWVDPDYPEEIGPSNNCASDVELIPGIEVWAVGWSDYRTNNNTMYLIANKPGEVRVLANLVQVLENPWQVETFEVELSKIEKVANRDVLILRAEYGNETPEEMQSTSETLIWYCALDKKQDPCVTVVEQHLFQAGVYDENDPELVAEFKQEHGQLPPVEEQFSMKSSLEPDGSISIRLVDGDKNHPLVTEQLAEKIRLW